MMSFTWDGENRLHSAGGATYVYDAEGNRVEKQGAGVTDTIFFAGRPVARLSAGQWTDLIYGPNGLIAEVPGTENGAPVYRLLDHLGNEVGTSDSSAALNNPLDYTPYGQIFAGNTNDPYLFTGKERDAESGLDYFGARYMASSMGRFMSPDFADFPDAIPYANVENPQSLNLYSYVQNNPLSDLDPDGHDCVVQSRVDDKHETVSVSSGDCKGKGTGSGERATYISGHVDGYSTNGGNSLDISSTNADGSTTTTNAKGAPAFDHPGIDGPANAAIFGQIGNNGMGAIKYFAIGSAVGGTIGGAALATGVIGGGGLTTLAGEDGFDMMANRALNRAIGDSQRKILDAFFEKGGSPEGLTQRSIKIYIEVAKRAIAAGKDGLGVQATRLQMLQNLVR